MRLARLRRRHPFAVTNGYGYGYKLAGCPWPGRVLCPRCGAFTVKYDDGPVCYGCVGVEFVDLEVSRAPYAPETRQGRPWTPEDNAKLRELWPVASQMEIGAALDRTGAAVRAQGRKLGLGRKPYQRPGGRPVATVATTVANTPETMGGKGRFRT